MDSQLERKIVENIAEDRRGTRLKSKCLDDKLIHTLTHTDHSLPLGLQSCRQAGIFDHEFISFL